MKSPNTKAIFAAFAAAVAGAAAAASQTWPEPTREMRPWVYNWWRASAIDGEGLERQCAELESKGFGGFHVIHIYGMNGPDGRYMGSCLNLNASSESYCKSKQ